MPLIKGCTGKVKFLTRDAAEAKIQVTRNWIESKRRSRRLNAYLCRECKFWHIGHTDKRESWMPQ